MSKEERQSQFPTNGSDTSRTPNAGFNGPLVGGDHGGTLDSFSHRGQPKRDLKKEVDKMYEEFLAGCPGSHGTNENFGNASPSLGQWNPLMNESRTSLSDTEGEESIRPMKPSENRDQHRRCVFHLSLEEEAESVKLQTEKPMLNSSITMNLHFYHEERHWISPELFIPPDQLDSFCYRYVVKYKEGITKKVWNFVTFRGNDEQTLKETRNRRLNSGSDQYDIFRNPKENIGMRTIFRGQLFYVKWLYQILGRGGDLKDMLIECEHVGFGHPSYLENDIGTFFQWVVESTTKTPSPSQCVYICCLLGQFVHRMGASAEDYCSRLETKAIDRLLLLLELCSFEALPKSSATFFKDVAECLFKAGSSTGCLLFIKIFCNLLDLEYVMQVADKLSSQSYMDQQFNGQVPSVLASLNLVKDVNSRNRFCSYVIGHAPSVECLWNLYDAMLQRCPDLLFILEEEFARVYLKFTSRQRARKPDLLHPCFWSAAPEKLKERLASPFCEVLVEQISSETICSRERTICSRERLDSLRSIALDPKLQAANAFCRLIMNVSSHKSVEMVSMILILLKSAAFLTCWRTRFSHEEMLKVSWNWVRSQFLGKKHSEQILAVVEASATIRATDAVKTNETLCRALLEQVEQMVLKANFQSVMEAVAVAQNRSPTILPRLITLLRMVIKNRSGAGDLRSRYKQMIRLLGYDGSREIEKSLQKVTLDRAQEELLVSIVELIQIQGEGEKPIYVQEMLKAMISHSELWVPLLRAVHPNSTLLQHPTVLVAQKALRCLTDEQQRQGLRVEFLLTLKNNEISLLAAYCVLVSTQESSIDLNKIEEWKALLSSECERAKIFCGRFSKVEQTFRFLKKVCEGCVVLSDADSIIDEINKRERVKVNATLKDALDVSYWGTLDKLIGSSETATKVQGSIIFANVAHLCLEENLASSQTAMGELAVSADDLPQHEAAEVLHLLENEGMHQFKEACTSLTDSEKDPRIVDVGALLSGIDSKEALGRELREVTSICGTLVPKRKEELLQNYLSFPLVCAKVQQLMSIYAALGFEDSKDEAVTKDLQDFMEVSSSPGSDLTLRRVSEIVEKRSVAMVNSELDDTLKTIMETLQMSSELISFMKETANEDIRILIDAVEEHSDQFVSEAIVSDLIDVHGFLRNILRQTPKDPMMFLDSLKKCYRKLEKKSEMAAKIKECGCNVHSLRGLYMNVANRGEMTKEIINNAVQKGCYSITTNSDGSSDVQLSYRRNESAAKETTYSMTELHDLRSRALLILNTDKKQEQVGNSDDSSTSFESVNQTLPTFIKQVEMITDIVNIVTLLRESGHPKYESFWQNLTSSHDIESQARTLESTLEDWETLLKRLQEQHYFLNFFHPDQLWLLHKFFSKRLTKTQSQLSLISSVHSLLRFVDPSVQREELDDFRSLYNAPKGNSGLKGDLQAIGKVLDRIFIPRQSMQMEKIPQHDLQRAVKPGDLFVAVLEHGSKQTANVVMSLFESTTGSFPQPSQVLFCHSETSWEEVERLLKRSFEAHSHSTVVKLHCLANVENLSNDMQFELVTAIRTYQKKVEGPYLLALVCCGGIHHHIADQFSTAAHNILGMSEPKLRDTFKENFPNVFMVTSDLPGVGKTEAIHEHAASCKKKALTLPISGPLSRKNLLKRLSGLSISPHECIHFDIGEVDDPLVLDSMMFELVVVGMMSCGTELFHLPTKHVYIEIANTLKHWLQNSLPITKCFSPLHVNLVGYKDLVVSQEPLSPVQVVCQYLHAYESGLLETKDLNPVNLKPLSPNQCKQLLSRHFSSTGDLSYNIVESFLKVFADQLLQFSESPFFKTHNLHAALGPQHDVRNCLFKALLEVSREFASRSVVTCKDVQSEAISKEQASEVLKKLHSSSRNDAKEMVERVEGMIQWADNNHLVIAFHRLEAFTISALYRDLSLVPSNVQKLLKVQAKKGEDIKDFAKLNHRELQERLDLIVQTTPRQNDGGLQKLDYALTPDNILKMVLIIQRIKARIPVIVMGETGCGKTSLVRYLARTCGVPFHVFNFHAGVTEEEVINFIDKREVEAKNGKEVWVFLDEINTCEYLGTINEVICHRSIKGKPITANLVFIAACNPYRLRPPGKITTAGLSEKIETDEFSKLVYRVHPLPETMIDFVWDYGSLGKDDEHAYIRRMVEGITGKPDNLLADLLCTSQQYIRDVDGSPYCVSLRDAHRCIFLVNWFKEALKGRKDLPLAKFSNRTCHEIARGRPHLERSFVLALAHCYQSRLPTAEARKGYQQRVAECFRKHKKYSFQEKFFEAIVRAEQEDYLERMELPEGTAKNGALRENVFVMLVCILNRIPVFVVGKPGCSKSLSMQIIRSNLRGKDAKDSFLKKLPQLYVVSHQGSESSTSDGILKVFEKARKYKEHNKGGDILPVVLLDEIGLAEVSKYNPLKVLHSLLEPCDGAFPDVAVVGISNWALDAAKMNRAIHLSRPEPDVNDLFDTGKSLREAGSERTVLGVSRTRSGHPVRKETYPDDNQLRCLAEAYHEYQGSQKYAHFHGLRDYYSLIKCLSSNRNHDSSHHPLLEEKTKGIQHALQRNFGGVPSDVNNFQTLFQKRLHSLDLVEKTYPSPVTQLIRDNLHDKLARHLMIITNGDAAIGILDQTLQSLDKEKITIFGSRFEEDLSEEYNYRMLSRIILCMERDCVLILRDLESIYGSLYDMLNQNYSVVGGKRNCRVALGAFSNPMCQVHDGFRCIVLIDQRRVDFTDPPFLNRFEKQLLRFADVLDGKQRSIITSLNEWVRGISTIPGFESQFHEEDMFVGFCCDTLPSLVLKNSQEEELSKDEILVKCKQDLILVASPDGVLRSLESSLAKTNFEEVQTLYKSFFEMPLHSGLKEYLQHSLEALQLDLEQSDDAASGMRQLIMTHSNIHFNVAQCLEGLLHCQTEKLSAFKSEKHLTKQLERFWRSSDSLLVLQCKPELDASHMLLAKSIIEQQGQKYKEAMETSQSQIKHVCIIVHVQRESDANELKSQHWQFSFQSGWKQVTIDVLESPALPITECLDVSVIDLMNTESLSFIEVASNEFLWCFTRIKYPAIRQPSVDEILKIAQLLRLPSNSKILECFKELVKRWLNKRLDGNSQNPEGQSWQFSVACDRQALIRSSHLVGAIEHYVSHLVRHPLAKIIYILEKESAWPKFLYTQDPSDEEELQVWSELILDQEILNIEDIPDHQGVESYFVPERHLQLKFPLAAIFCNKVDQLQPLFADDRRGLLLNEANLDENGELHDVAAESQLYRFSSMIKEKIPHMVELEYLQQNVVDYVEDLIDMKTIHFSDVFSREERIEFLKCAMANHIKFRADGDPARLITRLHSLFWLNEASYTAALQVYATCSKIKHLDLTKVFWQLSTVFEEMLFQSKDQLPSGEIDDTQCRSYYKRTEETDLSCNLQNDQQNAESKRDTGETLMENPTPSQQLERSNEKRSGEQEKPGTGYGRFQEVKGGQAGSLGKVMEGQKELVENVEIKTVDEPDQQGNETQAVQEHLLSTDGSLKGNHNGESCVHERADNGENSGDMDENSRPQEPSETAEVAQHQYPVKTTSVKDGENEGTLNRVEDVNIPCEADHVEKGITTDDQQEYTSEGVDEKEAEEKPGQENVPENDEGTGGGTSVVTTKEEGLRKEVQESKEEDDNKAVEGLEEEVKQDNEQTEEESDQGKEDTEEEVSDDGACDAKRIGFDEVLVETLCSALFPTSDVIESFEGLDNWQRTTSLFLSTVSRLQVESPAFHFLRVCYDYVTLLVLPESLEPYSLYMLGSLGQVGNSEGYLDSQEVLNRIADVVDEVAKRGVQQKRVDDFLMLFYGRCIDSDPDNPVIGSILERICRSGENSLFQLAGPLVHRVFLIEEEFSPGVFEKLLDSPESIGDHPGLQETSCALSTLPDDVELDSPFAVVCCDLINEVAFLDIDFSTVSGSEDRPLLNFRKAFQILTEPSEEVEQSMFLLLCAVAYLKAFLTSFCTFILEKRSYLLEDGEFSMLMNEINAAFTLNGADQLRDTRISELQFYFLKELRKNLPMYQIYTLCQTSCKLSALKTIQGLDDDRVGKLSFDPFQSFLVTSEVQAALATLLEKRNFAPLENVITSMSHSVEMRVEVAAVLAKSFFLVRSTRDLKDTEDKAIALFTEKLKNMETPYVNLLQRITGKKDFNAPKLCVSPESLPEDVHKSTLILHLCIILASSYRSTKKGMLAMMSYFVDPIASVDSYVLASGEGGLQPYKKHWNYDVTRQLTTTSSPCSCGTFFVVVDDGKEASCPNCWSNFKSEKKGIPNGESVQEETLALKGYVSLLNSDDISLCVRQLKPAEFRILHLFVHAALYGGFALELFDNSSLGHFLKINLNESDPSKICFQQILNDLKVLCSILNAKEEEVIRLLHCALQECSSILTSANFCSSPDERLSWEKKFAASIGHLLREFYPRKLLERSVDGSLSVIQRKIEETDSPQFSDMNERNLHIPRLLRVTLPKTFNALKSYYMSTEDKEREKFPLLGLFLDFNDSLPLVAHLVHLVSWSRIVDSLLSRRLSRKDTNKKIGDVIRERAKSQAEREQLNEAFENFTTAFEKMRPLLKEELQKDVPYISESSPISLCLVEKRDQGVFLCVAIEVLQKIQNNFLQKVLSIGATGKSSALMFLERDKGKCSIPMVHVQDAREKEVIQYQWTDAILRNSQRNTEYGHGKEMFYDLAKIEKEMAARFLVGKAFLSTFDGLREFIFSRELFHTCRGILDELQELIPQQPLTDILRSGLARQSEHSLESVQELLEQMEIVLCLLKRHQHGKPEEPLTEFTDKWLCGSRPFPKQLLPQPHSAIQLMHVVALYEFLEDTLAESAAKRVHDTYRTTIPKEITDDMAKAAFFSGKSEKDRSTLRAITTALRRFIFRYLSSEEMRPKPGECLAERMQESSLWPMDLNNSWKSPGVESLEKVLHIAFPETLIIGQTYQVLCFYQERLKSLEEAKVVSRTPASKGGRPTVERSRQKKKGLSRFSYS